MPALSDRILQFARLLRRAGLRVGTGDGLQALIAVQTVGVGLRADFKQALACTLVHRQEDRFLFDQAFDLFWQVNDPQLEQVHRMLQQIKTPPPPPKTGFQRLLEAMQAQQTGKPPPQQREQQEEIELFFTYSDQEVSQTKDFAQFTQEELKAAQRFLQQLRWQVPPYPSRRYRSHPQGHRLQVRQTLRRALRTEGLPLHLVRARRQPQTRPLIVLCDISGSMERYARVFLHFIHALSQYHPHVESFVFGTRLTRITRLMRQRDVEVALNLVSGAATDWSGGTKIGDSLTAFNRDWLRRVLPSRGVVLVLSDAWDCGDQHVLTAAMATLSRSCHRLIWLNPLLGFEGFSPETQGIQTILPFVDDFKPLYNLVSLLDLAHFLADLPAKPQPR